MYTPLTHEELRKKFEEGRAMQMCIYNASVKLANAESLSVARLFTTDWLFSYESETLAHQRLNSLLGVTEPKNI